MDIISKKQTVQYKELRKVFKAEEDERDEFYNVVLKFLKKYNWGTTGNYAIRPCEALLFWNTYQRVGHLNDLVVGDFGNGMDKNIMLTDSIFKKQMDKKNIIYMRSGSRPRINIFNKTKSHRASSWYQFCKKKRKRNENQPNFNSPQVKRICKHSSSAPMKNRRQNERNNIEAFFK